MKPRPKAASRGGIPLPRAASARVRISSLCARARRTAAAASASGSPLRTAMRRQSGLQAGAQRFHRRRADAAHLVELIDGGKAAVLIAVFEDLGGGDGADAVDRFELLQGGAAEADRPLFRSGRSRGHTGP